MYKNTIAVVIPSSFTHPLIKRLATWSDIKLLNTEKGDLTYTNSMGRFENIAQANILLVLNDLLTDRDVDEILYAMLLKKPVIINSMHLSCNQPFAKEVIFKRLNKMFVGNFSELNDEELNPLLVNIATTSHAVNYVLTSHEATLIRAQLRSFFRNFN